MAATEQTAKKRILDTSDGDYQHGERERMHVHADHFQLKWCSSGIMRIHTAAGLFVLPSTRALWIPPGLLHGATYLNGVRELNLYLSAEHCGGLPQGLLVTTVSERLRNAIEDAVQRAGNYDLDDRGAYDRALLSLLAVELRDIGAKPLEIVLPEESRLQIALTTIRSQPNDDTTLASWAQRLQLSQRTLTRLFKQETGGSFVSWRKRARVLYALERLAAGADVSQVARELGYRSNSAFIYMFRREVGTTPGQYYHHDAEVALATALG